MSVYMPLCPSMVIGVGVVVTSDGRLRTQSINPDTVCGTDVCSVFAHVGDWVVAAGLV